MRISPRTTTTQPELRSDRRIQTSCPNFARKSYAKDEASKPPRQIGVATFTRRLKALDLGPHSPVMANATRLAAKCQLEPRELLHMAIFRASKPKASRPDIALAPYLTMLMRSIASGINLARKRAADCGVVTAPPYVAEQLPTVCSISDPHQEILRADEQGYFAGLIAELQGGDPIMEKLVDCIGKGERGRKIEQALSVGTGELATLRKNLKRRAQAIAKREGLMTG